MGARSLAVMVLLMASVADTCAETVVLLRGKAAFDWHSNPSRQRCVIVDGTLLAVFNSTKYRCDLEPKSNAETKAIYRVCTAVKGGAEFLIFETRAACESERKAQAANQ